MLDEKTWLIMAVLVHPIENPVLSSSQAPPYQNHLNISAWALPCALWAVMLVGIWCIYAKKNAFKQFRDEQEETVRQRVPVQHDKYFFE